MPMHGGRTPYDEAGALVGPARALYAPVGTPVPTDIWDIIPAVADSQGEYNAKTGWFDFGLAADAPSYSHNRDSEGLEYEQPSGALFQQITSIERQMVLQVAHIDEKTLQIIENANTATTIAAGPNESAQKKVNVGLYSDTPVWRVVLVSFRPGGAGIVTEPPPSPVGNRPPLVARVIPRCVIAAEESELEFGRGDPVNAEVTFSAENEPTAPAGGEHGFWIVEQPGTIV